MQKWVLHGIDLVSHREILFVYSTVHIIHSQQLQLMILEIFSILGNKTLQSLYCIFSIENVKISSQCVPTPQVLPPYFMGTVFDSLLEPEGIYAMVIACVCVWIVCVNESKIKYILSNLQL